LLDPEHTDIVNDVTSAKKKRKGYIVCDVSIPLANLGVKWRIDIDNTAES
jgi:hypothetical protein